MFNDTSIIKEVNILNKVVCYLLVLIGLIILKDPVFILFVDIFFLLITKQYKKLFIFNTIITFFIILSILFPHFLWISKFSIIVIYTILLKKVTKLTELRYVIETTLYHFHQKKITYKLFYSIFFLKNFINHIRKMFVLKDDYSIKFNPKFLLFVLKQSFIKAKLGKKDFLEINNSRFYNYSKSRTYIEKNTWESWDTNYLISHVAILVLTAFYGR